MVNKAFVDKDTCIGCIVCGSLCPEVFTVREDPQYGNEFKSFTNDGVEQEPLREKVDEAILNCPVNCISWKEKKIHADGAADTAGVSF